MDFEYISSKKESTKRGFMKNITNKFNKHIEKHQGGFNIGAKLNMREDIEKERDKIWSEVQDHFESTKRSWIHRDCKDMNGKKVYEHLVIGGRWTEIKLDIEANRGSIKETINFCYNKDSLEVPIHGSYLFDFKGTLFIDNLHCYHELDRKYYQKLAKIIKEQKIEEDDPIFKGYPQINIPNEVSVNWLVVYAKDFESFHQDFIKQFELFSLAREGTKLERRTDLPVTPEKLKSVETTLSYDKTTGRFSFGGIDSIAISKTSKARVRSIAEKLMKWWKEGKPCPQSEIVKDPYKRTPQGIHDDISTIREAIKRIEVNMPQCTSDGYPPPVEPKNFSIVSRKLD